MDHEVQEASYLAHRDGYATAKPATSREDFTWRGAAISDEVLSHQTASLREQHARWGPGEECTKATTFTLSHDYHTVAPYLPPVSAPTAL